MIVTIDGPAGSGKSTAARGLAKRLGLAYLDTGAMYRAVTLRAMRKRVPLNDPKALGRCAREAELKLLHDGGELHVLLDGEDVSREIRSIEVTENSHYPAAAPQVRAAMVAMQRRIAAELGGVVTEGRDQGSVAFPEAEVKFYLLAAPPVRARRRWKELRVGDEQVGYEQVHDALVARDRRDESRQDGPLVKPDGAIEIDTTGMDIEAMVDLLARHVEERG